MSIQDPHINALFHKYMDRSYTEQELDELLAYFNLDKHDEQLHTLISRQLEQPVPKVVDTEAVNKAIAQMDGYVMKYVRPEKKMRAFSLWATAIAAILLLALGLVFQWVRHRENPNPGISIAANDVAPGSNKATITLSDGSRYDLSGDKEGITIGVDGIAYTDGGLITATDQVVTAVIAVPRGGIYHITLQDGTKVSLNSGSALHYPVRFNGTERKVELEGEGYFEVARNPQQPFIVQTGAQELKVLGTHFNIQAYPGEQITSTLAEGSIVLTAGSRTARLTPGQQAILKQNHYNIREVSADDYTAWTRNLFVFDMLPLSEIFKEMERWYDVEIDYPAVVGDEEYFMKIPKDQKLSQVLTSLSTLTNLKYTIEERRVMVRQ